jgi:hypothetical protein
MMMVSKKASSPNPNDLNSLKSQVKSTEKIFSLFCSFSTTAGSCCTSAASCRCEPRLSDEFEPFRLKVDDDENVFEPRRPRVP